MVEQLHGTTWHPTKFVSKFKKTIAKSKNIHRQQYFCVKKFHEYVYGLWFYC